LRSHHLAIIVLLLLGNCEREPVPPAAPRSKFLRFEPRAANVDASYDLASDISARTEEARARFGRATRVRVEGEAFVLVDADHGALFGPADALVQRVIHAFLAGPFRAPPDHSVTVDLFSSHAAYVAFSKARYGVDPEPHEPENKALFGYYRNDTREMLVDGASGWGTLVHELTHPFIQRDWDRAPTWLSEGIASLFEAYAFAPDGSIHGVTNWRYDTLRGAMDSPDSGPRMHLQALFDTSNDDFEQSDGVTQGRWYSLARFVCQWLDSADAGHKLWDFYALYRDTQDQDPSGLTAFTRALGWTASDADARWLAYVRRLRDHQKS
jgi:hypothetical protein